MKRYKSIHEELEFYSESGIPILSKMIRIHNQVNKFAKQNKLAIEEQPMKRRQFLKMSLDFYSFMNKNINKCLQNLDVNVNDQIEIRNKRTTWKRYITYSLTQAKELMYGLETSASDTNMYWYVWLHEVLHVMIHVAV